MTVFPILSLQISHYFVLKTPIFTFARSAHLYEARFVPGVPLLFCLVPDGGGCFGMRLGGLPYGLRQELHQLALLLRLRVFFVGQPVLLAEVPVGLLAIDTGCRLILRRLIGIRYRHVLR